MMRVLVAVLCCVAYCGTVRAETITASSHDAGFCKILTRHVPEGGTEYVPGSEDVIPPDLQDRPFYKLQDVVIPLDVNLKEYSGLDIQEGIELKPQITTLRITPEGRVLWNGADLSVQAAEYCGLLAVSPPEETGGLEENKPPQQLLDEKGEELYGAYPE